MVLCLILSVSTFATADELVATTLRKRNAAPADCLASLSSAPEPSSAVSFSCAQLLNARFYTATETFSTPTTVSDMQVTIRVLTETARTPTTVPGKKTITHWNNVTHPATFSDVTVSATKTITSNWDAWVISATKTVEAPRETATITKTIGRSTITATKLITEITSLPVKTRTETVYSNPLPDPLPESACPPELASAACSLYITAPVPTPVTTVSTVVLYPTLTTFTDTHAITITSTLFTITTPGPSSTTVTQQSTIFKGTSIVYVGHTTTVTTLGTKTSFVSTYETAGSTVTVTKTVPTVTLATVTQTHTPVPDHHTKLVTLPGACSSQHLLSGRSWSPLVSNAFKSVLATKAGSRDDQLLCCAACYEAEGCAIYEFELGKSCTLKIVSGNGTDGKSGWVSGTCPNGQLLGKVVWDGAVGGVGVGPCWNGEVTGYGGA
ncbi:hypothetical protein BJ508DRAFT_413739 [Ascobolus immersus RN42]|uniref:Apple domain-containing protein n=1 Tax=Ascobolus immersus RN42 TaxID=1160509 RepID=A0A3N4IC83_ASCIM|nr:hypothetical protein BJ508DRAFT_413739 [Ascobolus immersus RN42]